MHHTNPVVYVLPTVIEQHSCLAFYYCDVWGGDTIVLTIFKRLKFIPALWQYKVQQLYGKITTAIYLSCIAHLSCPIQKFAYIWKKIYIGDYYDMSYHFDTKISVVLNFYFRCCMCCVIFLQTSSSVITFFFFF